MSKYHNKKIEIDGYKFDSIKEGNKYSELKLLKAGGAIKDFEVHPRFKVFDGFKKDGKTYRAIYYIADFRVTENNGDKEIIDIKPFDKKTGKFLLTQLFRVKAKLFDVRYPELTLIIE